MFIKNTAGQESASLTMLLIAFAVVMLWMIASILTKIGPFDIRPFSGAEAMSVLSPLAMLYYGRRHTDSAKPEGTEDTTVTVVSTTNTNNTPHEGESNTNAVSAVSAHVGS